MAGETKSGGHTLSTPLKNGQRSLSETHQHQQIFLSTGALETLVLVFKHGHRQQMEGRIPAVAECMELATRATASGKASTLQRKLTMKLSQRVGLQYLPPRVAKWRYQRGQRSLLDNMNSAAASSSTAATDVHVQDTISPFAARWRPSIRAWPGKTKAMDRWSRLACCYEHLACE